MGESGFIGLSMEAIWLFDRIMKVNVGSPDGYVSPLMAIQNGMDLLRYYGVRCKVATEREGCAGEEVILIDPRNTKITTSLAMKWDAIRRTLKAHPEYIGSHTAHMFGGTSSCMYFKKSALDRVKAPAVVDGGARAVSVPSGESVSSGEELY